MATNSHFDVQLLLENQNGAIAWLKNQSPEVQAEAAPQGYDLLLGEANKPKSISGNAVVRLCGFVEQCSKPQSPALRDWAFSRKVCESLFNFYIERNESQQDRSLKLVLDLLVQLLKRNPDAAAASATQKEFLTTLISIITGSSTMPVAKSAIKSLDHFLTKKVYTADDLSRTYSELRPEPEATGEVETWRKFFAELLPWMRIHFVSQPAGRLTALLYRLLRSQRGDNHASLEVEVWYQWLLDFLADDVSLLEAIKNHIFVPLFNADRAEALKLLEKVNSENLHLDKGDLGTNASELLRLATLETGKRVGLVEEPALSTDSASGGESQSLVLPEKILTSVLSHPSHEVRSLAFSLLITSPSSTRPYSSSALDLLRKHIGTYFADPDAKFRVNVMANAREMFKRVRGSICVLKRSIPRARAKARQKKAEETASNGASDATPKVQPITYRTNLISLPEDQLVRCLDDHVQFLHWYIRFLVEELIPTASYQRHSASLKALASILRAEGETIKAWETADDQELFFDRFDATWARALFDLTMDRFDDVRDMAASCLKSILSDKRYRQFTLSVDGSNESPAGELHSLLSRCTELSRRTARFDHSDGAARASQLVYKFSAEGGARLSFLSQLVDRLEDKLGIAEQDLGRAVLEAPVHGDFAALRYIWQIVAEVKFAQQELEAVQGLQSRIIECCCRVWAAVKDVLCDDSPEGHLPQELEEMEGLNTKDVLSYSFRAIDESSNLLRSFILTIRSSSQEGAIYPSSESFEKIGNLVFEQLSTLRHRGAFTTVTNTFAACCQQAKHLDVGGSRNGEKLLNEWYNGALEAIFSQRMTTRRSAGIPALVTGILSSNASQPSFEQVMEKLIEIASVEAHGREADGSSLPQVHAYNCLKDIFKNSLLTSMGNKSERYLARCLELAANGLRSQAWAIRNCGLILLRSLIDSLFGTGESKTMIEAGWDGKANRIAYHHYATLPGALVKLLDSGHQIMSPTATDTASAEAVFPALDIVRRAGPPDTFRGEIQGLVTKYLASPVWHVREMAARTLCSCLLRQPWLEVIDDLLRSALQSQSEISLNYIHGILMALKFVFERLSEVAPDRIIANLTGLVKTLSQQRIDRDFGQCPDILATYLEVTNQISAFAVRHSISVEPIQVDAPPGYGSALLRIHLAKYQIYSAFRSEDSIWQLRDIFLGKRLGADTMTSALALLPELWSPLLTPDLFLSQLCNLYVEMCLNINANEPRAIALQNLGDIMDHLLGKGHYTLLESLPLSQLWAALPSSSMNPTLSNAIIRVSGCIMAMFLNFQQISPSGLQNWGLMVAEAGLEDEAFDTRFSAAEALRSFFALKAYSCASEEYLPALLALYDALNDDDDEVREVAASAVQSISGYPLVPIEASTYLLDWLANNLSTSSAFKQSVVSRLVGAPAGADAKWRAAEARLDAALIVDESLFVVEEQNLFIDEVREAKRWATAYQALKWEASDDIHARLDIWLQGGLNRLRDLMGHEDGPLGWASSPKAFAISSVVLLDSIAVVIHGQASPGLREGLRSVQKILMESGDKNLSGLLTEPLRCLDIG